MIIYPPLIADTIPAFTAAAVKIPFENNPAVVLSSVKGFKLIVKDYNSSSIIAYSTAEYTTNIIDEVIFKNFTSEDGESFTFTSGNYYKFQIAYFDNVEDTTFYYSSASIGRCVEKEKEIYIADLKENKLSEQASNPNIYNSFQGIYVSSMQSEPLYSYRFVFKNAITNEIVQDTGTLLFDNSKSYTGIYKVNFDIKKELLKDTVYTLQFFVTTINGYTTQTPVYKIIAASKVPITTELKLNVLSQDVEAFENGYVKLTITGTSTSAATV